MCHHHRERAHGTWTEREDDEETEDDEAPSFTQKERSVDIELLQADDD